MQASLADKSTSSTRALTAKVENPWLTIGDASTKLSRKKNEALVSKGSGADIRSQAALKKQLARSAEALAHQAEDAVVEIDLDDPLSLSNAHVSFETTTGKQRIAEGIAVDSAFQDSDDDDVDRDNGPRSTKVFKQRDLVALAFAGDNVVEVGDTCIVIISLRCLTRAPSQEFTSSKQKEVEAAAPKEIDTTLPGWVRTQRDCFDFVFTCLIGCLGWKRRQEDQRQAQIAPYKENTRNST